MGIVALPGKISRRKNSRVLCDKITKSVCAFYGLDIERVMMPGNKPAYVEARQISMYLLLRKYIPQSVIGEYFNRDHTTVIHARETITNRMDTDVEFEVTIREIQSIVSREIIDL